MTANQIIKRLTKAGIDTTGIEKLGKDEIEIWTGDADSTEKLKKKVLKEVCLGGDKIGGYKTGYGAWVLSSGYQDRGDWNDRTSAWHY